MNARSLSSFFLGAALLLTGCAAGGGAGTPPISPESVSGHSTVPADQAAQPSARLIPFSYHPSHTASERVAFIRATTVPLWTGTVASEGSNYSYTMIGTAPSTGTSTTIPINVVPVAFKFSDGTVLDPTVNVACQDPGKETVSQRFKQSPFFNNATYPSGTTQYHDAFQKANFWTAGGSQSGYHVLFSYNAASKLTITVPKRYGVTAKAGSCGNKIGEIDVNWFSANAEPQILKAGSTASLAYGLTYNLFLTQSGQCCILGYHDYSGGQLFGYGSYVDPGVFSAPIEDVSAIAHEFGEALDDPEINNATPAWGNIGQVSGCQSNLEVGDPLTGTNYPGVTLSGFTYHPQELVFWAWFFDVATTGQNGAYSNNGTFTTYAKPCT